MDIAKRLELHIKESFIHIERIENVLTDLDKIYPLEVDHLEELSVDIKDKMDVLAFRFAKLQDLLGTKIFREYLAFLQYPIEDKNYLELLKELEKEKILNIDIWSEFRGIRNSISHDYPYEGKEKVEAINYLIKNVHYLIDIAKKIKDNYETITKRD